ncbi:MAG: hypothetical protein U0271_32075 [Polyangiaceae bacterium]
MTQPALAPKEFARAENFVATIEIDGLATVRVWRRPDLTAQQGAELAERMLEVVRRLAAQSGVVGIMVDLREAPSVVGPRTEAVLGAVAAAMKGKGAVAFVAASDAMQQLQLKRITTSADRAAVVSTTEAARDFLLQPSRRPKSVPTAG